MNRLSLIYYRIPDGIIQIKIIGNYDCIVTFNGDEYIEMENDIQKVKLQILKDKNEEEYSFDSLYHYMLYC